MTENTTLAYYRVIAFRMKNSKPSELYNRIFHAPIKINRKVCEDNNLISRRKTLHC